MKFSILHLFDKILVEGIVGSCESYFGSLFWVRPAHIVCEEKHTHKTLKIRDASETAHTVCYKHPSMFIHKKNQLLVVTKMYNIPTLTQIK